MHPKRAFALAAAIVLALALAGPAAAARPTIEYQEQGAQEFAAGETCDFPVLIESPVLKAKVISLDRRDGEVRDILTGRIVERITNLDTGEWVERNASGPAVVTVNDAGHVVLRFNGESVFTLFDGDVTGRGLIYVRGGNAEFEIGDDGFSYVRADLPRYVEDLCATLG